MLSVIIDGTAGAVVVTDLVTALLAQASAPRTPSPRPQTDNTVAIVAVIATGLGTLLATLLTNLAAGKRQKKQQAHDRGNALMGFKNAMDVKNQELVAARETQERVHLRELLDDGMQASRHARDALGDLEEAAGHEDAERERVFGERALATRLAAARITMRLGEGHQVTKLFNEVVKALGTTQTLLDADNVDRDAVKRSFAAFAAAEASYARAGLELVGSDLAEATTRPRPTRASPRTR